MCRVIIINSDTKEARRFNKRACEIKIKEKMQFLFLKNKRNLRMKCYKSNSAA